MKTSILALSLLFLIGCADSFDPQLYLEELQTQAGMAEEDVATTLAIRSLPAMPWQGGNWDAQIGFVDDIPAFIRMTNTANKENKIWWSLDTANGKVLLIDEDAVDASGKSVRRLLAFKDDSLVLAKQGEGIYQAAGTADFRSSGAAANKAAHEIMALINADRSDLSAGANAARKRNAQFYASGKGWGLALNPSIKQVLFTEGSNPEQSFGYALPSTGPNNESLYAVRNLKEKMNFSIVSIPCTDANGRIYPYTVEATYKGKTFKGCGSIIQ